MPADPGSAASDGYTLVELIVAAVCLGIAVSGVMAMISAGRQMEMESGNRRQARMIANSTMEGDYLRYTNFINILDSTESTVKLNPGTPAEISATQVIASSVENFQMNNSWVDTMPVIGIQHRLVRVGISWSVAGRQDSVLVRKIITDF